MGGKEMSVELEYCFHAYVTIDKGMEIGPVGNGIRNIVPITGGKFDGQLKGVVVPGGADWQFIRDDGIMEVEARYTLKTIDHTLIYVVNKGIINPTKLYARTTPKFEVSDENYSWLCKSLFISKITPMQDETTPLINERNLQPNGVSIDFYRLM
jgi:hypothetical protein